MDAAVLARIEQINAGGIRRLQGAELRELNGEPEHAHLLVNFPSTVAISRLVNSLKGLSSRRLRQEFPDLRRHCWRAKRLWSGSYFAGSVDGAPITVLHQHIEQQNRPA
jgi:putative transposase